jgi:hypothetical protein
MERHTRRSAHTRLVMYPHNAVWIHNSDTFHKDGPDNTLTLYLLLLFRRTAEDAFCAVIDIEMIAPKEADQRDVKLLGYLNRKT